MAAIRRTIQTSKGLFLEDRSVALALDFDDRLVILESVYPMYPSLC